MTVIKALQGDTLDDIAYRYFADNSVAMLPALLELNTACHGVFLDEHQVVYLPENSEHQKSSNHLSLWD